MNETKIIIESLSMDLLRVALGYHRGSEKMAKRFEEESLARIAEVKITTVKPYFAKILTKLPEKLAQSDKTRLAEDALMTVSSAKTTPKPLLNSYITKLHKN